MRNILIIVLFFSLSGNSQISELVKAWQADPNLKFASIAFSVRDVSTGEIISELQSKQVLIPASTQKIFCTAAVLNKFGNDYRFETRIAHTGSIDAAGVLKGDVLIIGSGDPSLQSASFYNQKLAERWALELQKKGITQIDGAVIGDASAFERSTPATWLYEDVSNYFGAGVCALNYADNKFFIYLQSGPEGTAVKVKSTAPNYLHQNYELQCNVVASGKRDEAYVYGDPTQVKRQIQGNIPANKTSYEIEAALPDPALLCAEHFFTALQKLGIKVKQKAKSRYQKVKEEQTTVLYRHYSPPLEQLIAIANQNSNNQYTEAFRYLLGNGDAAQGLSEIKSYCSKLKLDTAALFLEDACGLSRLNLCSADAQCNFLYQQKKTSLGKVFFNSLSVAGKSGSLSSIGKGTSLEGNLTGKSGYITRARAYCGYLTTKSGKNLCFSIIINNFSCSGKAIKPSFESFFKALYDL